jgi:hypothetical protein
MNFQRTKHVQWKIPIELHSLLNFARILCPFPLKHSTQNTSCDNMMGGLDHEFPIY